MLKIIMSICILFSAVALYAQEKPSRQMTRQEINKALAEAMQRDRVKLPSGRPADWNRGTTVMTPAVGYRPVIVCLPQGTNYGVNAVVSGDRRYVRIGVNPMFSSIGPVHTFNMYTGENKRIR
jgi:hypothetical protein